MNYYAKIRNGFVCLAMFYVASNASALMPTNPVSDTKFTILPSGKDLRTISVSGEKLSLSRGSGGAFTATKKAAFEKLRTDSKTIPNYKAQWAFLDLDNHRVIEQSMNPEKKFFGASSSKIFVAGTLLNVQNEALSASQTQLMADMLVVSSNEAWTALQAQIGGGDANKGRTTVQAFTDKMGYKDTKGFQGYLGSVHGNELTVSDTAEYLHDIYKGNFVGAETLWKFMHTCRTGAERGREYLPASLIVGAKTGTYDGATVDPDTDAAMNVAIRNHVMVFNYNGHQYGLVVLANTGSDETAALLAAGLFREYTGYTP